MKFSEYMVSVRICGIQLLIGEPFGLIGDHKKAVDLLRSSLEKDVQDANALIASLRQEVSNQRKWEIFHPWNTF
jgi:hypothetical protein